MGWLKWLELTMCWSILLNQEPEEENNALKLWQFFSWKTQKTLILSTKLYFLHIFFLKKDSFNMARAAAFGQGWV